MSIGPSHFELLARARTDLRMGVPVLLRDQSRVILVLAAETVSEARFHACKTHGEMVLAITNQRAKTLKAQIYAENVTRIRLSETVDRHWISSVINPAVDLAYPLKGPFNVLRGGEDRLETMAINLCKSAQLLPAVLAVSIENKKEIPFFGVLTEIEWQALEWNLNQVEPVSHARLPMSVSEAGRLHIFRSTQTGEEHYAVEIGQPDRGAPVLSRLHSACFTGDVLGSLKCDCGPQLHGALELIAQAGSGVLLYLNQEGRGIGLANKMRAYSLQDQGFDTVEANHRLGFEDDERDFKVGSDILQKLGFSQVRLMTNNPRKVKKMEEMGVEVVERVPLQVGLSHHNREYLATKAKKSGHYL